MGRLSHGGVIPLEQVELAIDSILESNVKLESFGLASLAVEPPALTRFCYLWPELQEDPKNRLDESPNTVKDLINLGDTMRDLGTNTNAALDSGIPSIYTYFGQFVDHDITLEAVTKDINLNDKNLQPLPWGKVCQSIKNTRTATLDLDSIYGKYTGQDGSHPVPRNGDLLELGRVEPSPGFHIININQDPYHDLPREVRNPPQLDFDRAPKIGDTRNDEHAIISQMHLAFLRAHNAIVKQGNKFDKACKILRQHYQHIVIDDFLNRIADPLIVTRLRSNPGEVFDPTDEDFFMPLEFTVAAYRFGHSMVRSSYKYNKIFHDNFAPLYQLFINTPLGKYEHLPESWIIEWENFVKEGATADEANVARRIDTQLVEPLFSLPGLGGQPLKFEVRLAVRNLLRGYLLSLPTGQSVAQSLKLVPLTPTEILAVAANHEQEEVLKNSDFLTRTPLWFYILAEAAHTPGDHLGPLGSTLVAAVLLGVARRSEDSILKDAQWKPTLPSKNGNFTLPDLLRLADVLA